MSAQDPASYLRLATLNLKQGEHEAAVTCLRSALDAAGDDAAAREAVAAAADGAVTALEAAVGPGDSALAGARWVAAQARGLADPAAPQAAIRDVVVRLLAVGLEVTKTARVGLDLVVEATHAERGHLVLTDQARTAIGSAGAPPRPPQASEGIIEEAQRTRKTVVVGDALEDPRFADRASVQAFSIRSVLCIPLLVGDDPPLGVFYLESQSGPDRFGPAERALAEELAGIVAPALDNARRFSEQQSALARAERLYAQARESELRLTGGVRLLGNSPALRQLQAMINKVGPVEHTILIEGESGTGKELVARAIHERSPRQHAPFVAENMGALAEGVLEAELFGHVKGAFTGATEERPGLFQIASGGTILLDEIGELDLPMQAKLLRVIQEREVRPVGSGASQRVDVRILAATHKDLAAEVKAGRFREDLFYRLSVIRLRVPPLRDRQGDVALLLEHFLAQQAAEMHATPPEVSPQLMSRLERYAWPGNVRELQGYAARLLIAGPEAELGGEVPTRTASAQGKKLTLDVKLLGEAPLEMREARIVFDKAYLRIVLERFDNNISASAKALGLNRSYLSELVKRYRLKG